MSVELKSEIRKRIAEQMGTTCDDLRRAEAECDGRPYLYPTDKQGTMCGFYLLRVPVKGKIEPMFFPTRYFIDQKEDEE